MTALSEKAKTPMRSWPAEFYRSAVGKKWVMAVTGIVLLGFVLAHMIGNLKIYYLDPVSEGAILDYEIDLYGEALRTLLFPILPKYVLLWLMRLGLIAAAVLHVHAAYTLTVMNRRARPVDYVGRGGGSGAASGPRQEGRLLSAAAPGRRPRR